MNEDRPRWTSAPDGDGGLRIGAGRVVAAALATVTLAVALPAATAHGAADGRAAAARPWLDPRLSVARRVALLLPRLTLEEKDSLVHGEATLADGELASVYAGYVPAIPSLGIPALHLEDGPSGIGDLLSGVTDFPAPMTLAATWDTGLARRYGAAIGQEARVKGVNVLLAPTVNIDRVPTWGRAYESFGEDPLLTSMMATSDIEGIQSQGVIATVKHLAAYNQEYGRMSQSAEVSQRTLHEIYLRAFSAAVEVADVGAVMAAYNKVNGVYATENATLLGNLARWGFKGIVMSDWGATHSTLKSAEAGLDLEMNEGAHFGAPLINDVEDGSLGVAVLDRMVTHILTAMFAAGLFDRATHGSAGATATTADHRSLAENVAAEGTVLLKNRGHLLPLRAPTTGAGPVAGSSRDGGLRSIAVIDDDIALGAGLSPTNSPDPKFEGCGSTFVRPSALVTPASGIAARAGGEVRVTSVVVTDAALAAQITQAAAAARQDQVAVVVVHDNGCEDLGNPDMTVEGSATADRAGLGLPGDQDTLVDAVAAANPRTVVVLATQGAVLMPWLDKVPAVLETFYPGQEDGSSLAAVLFGDVDPSGRLPVTFPTSSAQEAVHTAAQYPGVGGIEHYSEGLDVGYRYDEAKGLTPLFPFGFGLSYTTFGLSHPHSDAVSDPPPPGSWRTAAEASVTVADTGQVAGAEVVQVYVGFPKGSGEPPRQLAGFARVELGPGRSAVVRVPVAANSLSVWGTRHDGWQFVAGRYHLWIGTSSESMVPAGTVTMG